MYLTYEGEFVVLSFLFCELEIEELCLVNQKLSGSDAMHVLMIEVDAELSILLNC
jgi:hypothetical protein